MESTSVWSALWSHLPCLFLLELAVSVRQLWPQHMLHKIQNNIWASLFFHFSALQGNSAERSVLQGRVAAEVRDALPSSPLPHPFLSPQILTCELALWALLILFALKSQINGPEMRLPDLKIVLRWERELDVGLEIETKWEEKRKKAQCLTGEFSIPSKKVLPPSIMSAANK